MSGIEAYDIGRQDGRDEERKRISDWIEENRTKFELVDGAYFYRDRFDSTSLLEFINDAEKEKRTE